VYSLTPNSCPHTQALPPENGPNPPSHKVTI
jgi:hypothetical protein